MNEDDNMKKTVCCIISIVMFILNINVTPVIAEKVIAKFYCAENFENGTYDTIVPVHLNYN